MNAEERVSVCDGKYTVVFGLGKLTALRYGEPWQDLTGNNLVHWLAVELRNARAALDALPSATSGEPAATPVWQATIPAPAEPDPAPAPAAQPAGEPLDDDFVRDMAATEEGGK